MNEAQLRSIVTPHNFVLPHNLVECESHPRSESDPTRTTLATLWHDCARNCLFCYQVQLHVLAVLFLVFSLKQFLLYRSNFRTDGVHFMEARCRGKGAKNCFPKGKGARFGPTKPQKVEEKCEDVKLEQMPVPNSNLTNKCHFKVCKQSDPFLIGGMVYF